MTWVTKDGVSKAEEEITFCSVIVGVYGSWADQEGGGQGVRTPPPWKITKI